MSRKKLPVDEKKVKISVCLGREINLEMETLTNNKSRYIEELIIKDLKEKKDGK